MLSNHIKPLMWSDTTQTISLSGMRGGCVLAGGVFGAVVHAAPDTPHGGRGRGRRALRGAPGLGGGLSSLPFPRHHAPCPSTCMLTLLAQRQLHLVPQPRASRSFTCPHCYPIICPQLPGSGDHGVLCLLSRAGPCLVQHERRPTLHVVGCLGC